VKMVTRSIVMLALVVVMSGCAVGQRISYHETELGLNASGSSQVAVASLDSRPYVKNGEKDKTYVGNLRGGFGNPFNLSTESGKPLADDMTSVICASLKKKGFVCTTVFVGPNETPAEVTGKLKATNAKSLILLNINEWLSSTYQNTGLTYDLVLDLMDNQGSILAEQKVKGEDQLGGSLWSPPAHAKEAVPQAFKKKLESLLNDPSVTGVLK